MVEAQVKKHGLMACSNERRDGNSGGCKAITHRSRVGCFFPPLIPIWTAASGYSLDQRSRVYGWVVRIRSVRNVPILVYPCRYQDWAPS